MQTYVRFYHKPPYDSKKGKLYPISQAAGYLSIDLGGNVFISNFRPHWDEWLHDWLTDNRVAGWQYLTTVNAPKRPELELYILEEE